jgi:hypothetical protein
VDTDAHVESCGKPKQQVFHSFPQSLGKTAFHNRLEKSSLRFDFTTVSTKPAAIILEYFSGK